MIFGLHVIVELDDVGMMQLLEYFSLVEYLLLARFVHAFDGHELQLLLPPRFEDHRVFAACFLLVDVVFVHFNI
jgi:hypothetical protein